MNKEPPVESDLTRSLEWLKNISSNVVLPEQYHADFLLSHIWYIEHELMIAHHAYQGSIDEIADLKEQLSKMQLSKGAT